MLQPGLGLFLDPSVATTSSRDLCWSRPSPPETGGPIAAPSPTIMPLGSNCGRGPVLAGARDKLTRIRVDDLSEPGFYGGRSVPGGRPPSSSVVVARWEWEVRNSESP